MRYSEYRCIIVQKLPLRYACLSRREGHQLSNKDEILEDVLDEFSNLAKIPRKSGHEKAVSDYLKQRLEGMGLSVVQDDVNNIIADMPASPGYEGAPRTILQCHMDMVCVAEEGVSYDPLTDPIRLHRTDEILEAEGTSLGSDDGSGIAIIIHTLKSVKRHGSLRMIVTVDEEQGMTGAVHLDKKYLSDADFLINCESENYDELTVGSAGSVNLDFEKDMKEQKSVCGSAYEIAVSGLKGGHSGEQIGSGRGNAIHTLAYTIQALLDKGHTELSSMHGGKARNAIPDASSAVIVTDIPEDKVKKILRDEEMRFSDIYGDSDPGISIELKKVDMPEKVLDHNDAGSLLDLLSVLHTGVYVMSQNVPGLVETSANLGVVDVEDGHANIQFFPRSGIDAEVEEFTRYARAIARMSGFKADIGMISPGWKENKHSRLAGLMSDIFNQQNNKPMNVDIIHAGLECGWHFMKNPKLDMVSIGVTTKDIHSPNEKLVLSTVRPQAELIRETIERIAEL